MEWDKEIERFKMWWR